MTDKTQGYLSPNPKVYFITLSVFRYIDIFTRRDYIDLIVESLRLYQEEYGLIIYDWIIMTNHIHLIANIKEGSIKSLIMDFKRFTAIQMLDAIKHDPLEVRKDWLLEMLRITSQEQIFWRGNYHAQAIYYKSFYLTKQKAMYKDPVRSGIVADERDYLYSSCAAKYENKEGILTLTEVQLFEEAEEL